MSTLRDIDAEALRAAIIAAVEALEAVAVQLPEPEQPWRGSKTQITITIAPELLKRIEAMARRDGLSRSALFAVWANEALRKEEAV